MKSKLSMDRYHNSRFTIIENKRISTHSFKKSKTRSSKLNKIKNFKKTDYKNIKKNQKKEIPNHKIGSMDIQEIFTDIVKRINQKSHDPSKKLKIEKNGLLKVISEDSTQALTKSKTDLVSGSLINNYWPGDSLYTKDRISKFEDPGMSQQLQENSEEETENINQKIKNMAKKAKDMVENIF